MMLHTICRSGDNQYSRYTINKYCMLAICHNWTRWRSLDDLACEQKHTQLTSTNSEVIYHISCDCRVQCRVQRGPRIATLISNASLTSQTRMRKHNKSILQSHNIKDGIMNSGAVASWRSRSTARVNLSFGPFD